MREEEVYLPGRGKGNKAEQKALWTGGVGGGDVDLELTRERCWFVFEEEGGGRRMP